jgi:hypothetical protein
MSGLRHREQSSDVALATSAARWRRGSMILSFVAAMAAVTEREASSQTFAVQPVHAATPSVEIASDREEVSAPFRIANTGATPLTISVVAQPVANQKLVACGEGQPECTLGWLLQGQRLSPGNPRELEIPPFKVADLTLEGTAKFLGTYTATLILGPAVDTPAIKPITYTVKLSRKAASLGSDAVQFGPGGTRTRGALGALRPDRQHHEQIRDHDAAHEAASCAALAR